MQDGAAGAGGTDDAGDSDEAAAGANQPPAGTEPRPLTYRLLFRYATVASLAVLMVFIGALAIYALRGLIVQILVAAFIAVSLDPIVRWLIAHKIKRSRAVALVVTVFLLLLAGLGYATIPKLVDQATQLGR